MSVGGLAAGDVSLNFIQRWNHNIAFNLLKKEAPLLFAKRPVSFDVPRYEATPVSTPPSVREHYAQKYHLSKLRPDAPSQRTKEKRRTKRATRNRSQTLSEDVQDLQPGQASSSRTRTLVPRKRAQSLKGRRATLPYGSSESKDENARDKIRFYSLSDRADLPHSSEELATIRESLQGRKTPSKAEDAENNAKKEEEKEAEQPTTPEPEVKQNHSPVSPGGVNCQVVRTISPLSGASYNENSIYEAIVHAIKQSQHYVYIENQCVLSSLPGSNN